MRSLPTWQALPPFKIGCGRAMGQGESCDDYPHVCGQCLFMWNINTVVRDAVRNACVAVLERARCDMLGKVRKEYVDLSDVTVDLFEGIEVCDMNGIVNQLQDMVKEAYK